MFNAAWTVEFVGTYRSPHALEIRAPRRLVEGSLSGPARADSRDALAAGFTPALLLGAAFLASAAVAVAALLRAADP